MEWKWTRGEPYERTRRMKHQQEIENKEFSKETEKDAYTTSLNHDENTWEIMNQDMYGSSGFKVSNKRDREKECFRHLVKRRAHMRLPHRQDCSSRNCFLNRTINFFDALNN